MENGILKIMEWNLNFASSDDVKPASFIRDYLIEDYINVFTEVRANEGLQEIGNELDYDSILSDDTEESSNQIVIMAPKAYNLQKVQGALDKSPAPDFLHGIITVDQKKINIIGTRIRVLDYKKRFKQLQALNEYIENINGAVVCMGDFNSGQIRGDEKASYNEVKSLYKYTKEKKLSDLRFYNFHIIKEIFLEKAHLIEPKGEDNSWGLLERNGKILPGYPGARVKNDLLLYSKDLNLVSSFYSWKHVRDNEQIYLDMLFKNSKRRGNKIEHGYPDHARLIAELEVKKSERGKVMNWKGKEKQKIEDYLHSCHIQYTLINENRAIVAINDINSIYLSAWIPDVISGCIETTLQFQDEGLTVQSYYGKSIVKTEEEALRAAQIITWMNHNLNWDCNTLYEHTYGFVEEDGDLYNYCRIRYELLDDYFDESMNHILNYSVQQLSFVCYPVVAYISGKISYEEAKIMIKTNVQH